MSDTPLIELAIRSIAVLPPGEWYSRGVGLAAGYPTPLTLNLSIRRIHDLCSINLGSHSALEPAWPPDEKRKDRGSGLDFSQFPALNY